MSDINAERILVDAAPSLLAHFRRRVEALEDAADLVSETVTTAWQSTRRMPRDPEQARMWVFGVARNTLRHHHRTTSRRDALAIRLASTMDPAPWKDEGIGIEVRQAVAALPAELGELIRLVHWDGFTLEQAATLMGVTPSTLRTRHARAKQLLRHSLIEVDPGSRTGGWLVRLPA